MKNLIVWTPRVISLILISFISFFALDSFHPEASFLNNTLSILIELLPAIILLLALVLAWFYRLAGGITYIILGVAMTFFFHTYRNELTFLTLSSPVLVVGVLFVLSYYYEKAAAPRT